MADLSKFEKMLELLINEDKDAAEELFHEIVVEKSRDIYESLLEDEDEEVDESDDEEVDESDDDLDESDDEDDESDDDLDEGFDLDEFEVEADDDMMRRDATDDMMADLGMDDDEEGDDMDMGGEGDTEDRIEDLEDALEDLKAEFEKLMGGGDSDDMDGDDMGDEEDDDMDMGDEEDEEDEEEKESYAFEAKKADKKDDKKVKKTAGEEMREYVEKISGGGLGAKIGGDNGVNTKSSVAGKNDMGGTTANIAKSGTEAGVEANKGNLKGSALNAQNPKDMNTKNVNVVGAKGATKMSNQPGHGAEKKGKPETADKSASSMLNGAPKRAK